MAVSWENFKRNVKDPQSYKDMVNAVKKVGFPQDNPKFLNPNVEKTPFKPSKKKPGQGLFNPNVKLDASRVTTDGSPSRSAARRRLDLNNVKDSNRESNWIYGEADKGAKNQTKRLIATRKTGNADINRDKHNPKLESHIAQKVPMTQRTVKSGRLAPVDYEDATRRAAKRKLQQNKQSDKRA